MKTQTPNARNHPGADIASFVEILAQTAGANLMKYFRNLDGISYKKDHSVVTDADLSTEELIIGAIRARFKEDAFLAEESAQLLPEGSRDGYVWIIDPLDGTSNFANGYGFFCTSIARYRFDGNQRLRPELGVIFDPCRNALYSATSGVGAWKNEQKLSVRKPSSLAKAFLVTGFSYVKDSALEIEINRFKKIAHHCQTIRRDGAAALDMAMVADGTFHAFWENNLSPWDLAAGALLVSEAGGAVRNYGANESYDVMDGSIIAGYPETVEQLAVLLV
jgi:myo-inositol-1(or 4)-monophosphatase